MKSALLALPLLAASVSPLLAQAAPGSPGFVPPYSVRLVSATGFDLNGAAAMELRFDDVESIQGPSMKILSTPGADNIVHSVPRTSSFSFVREWDDLETSLSALPGQAGSYADIRLHNDTSNILRVMKPQVTEWVLSAEQGAVATESVRFTYSGKQVIRPYAYLQP